eukprot:scaffold215880_cov30-Tisochrysis_lutea.AAC.1
MLQTAGGCQGYLAPSGSDEITARPEELITLPVSPSMRMRVGMPETLNMEERRPLRLSPCGMAIQGISPKYSANEAVSLSEEQKMTSNFLPSARTLL